MIDPIQALSFSLHSNPGAYALLLGSGISQAAGIPTGWDITLELVRKLALLDDENPPDPAVWYQRKYSKQPDYADLLDVVTQTPTERQQLLRSYWEASDSEREEGLKKPTIAHRRIADLVSKGFIRVIITTNFDRLLETALVDAGITPTVLSSADHIQGALPLVHTKCCVLKVHGDYLDTRIRNTSSELASYDPAMDAALDRILDDFGLIICGWSAEWDVALRAALIRSPSRRFALYWAVRGKLGAKASEVLERRAGSQIAIQDADTFFQRLYDQVSSLQEFARPHPLSKEMAVANLKKFLSEDKYRIQLDDLIIGEAETAKRLVDSYGFTTVGGPVPTPESYMTRVTAYNGAMQTLGAMAIHAGYWSEDTQGGVWRRALELVHDLKEESGQQFHAWEGLVHFPSSMLLYALGIGAVQRGNLTLLRELFLGETRANNRELTFAEVLPPACAYNEDHGPAQFLIGYQRHGHAMNKYLHDQLRPHFLRLIPREKAYTLAFDKFEILLALAFTHHQNRSKDNFWAPPGLWFHHPENREQVFKEIGTSLSDEGKESVYVKSQLFGSTHNESCDRFVTFKEGIKARFPYYLH